MTDAPPPTPPTGPADSPESAGDDPLVGRVLAGRYRILRKLGEGAMGAVYLGEHLRFGRKDAIKVIRGPMARDREAKDRFLRGARNASAIKHGNVCTVYDFADTEEGLQFLAMEYVEGETLADVLEREGALPLPRAVGIVRQTAAALDAAHDLDIVHRDLKPGNVMLARARDGSDLVKVVDFDIAKGSAEGEGREVTRMGFVVGTPEYMSPEQLTGDPLDGRSDLYSLGVVLFRCLTGALPVRAENTQDLMVERLTRDPLTLAEARPDLTFPAGLQGVLDRALARRRDDRFADAPAMARALAAVAAGQAPDAAPTRASEGPSPTGPAGAAGGTSTGGRPASGGTDSGRAVPPTRVGPVGGGDPNGGGGGPGRLALIGGGGGVFLVALALGWVLLRGTGGDAAPPAGGGPDSVPVAEREDTGPPTGDDREPPPDDPVVDSPAVSPEEERGPEDDPVTRDDVPELPGWLRDPAATRETLADQLTAILAGAGPARIEAVVDTARAVWDAPVADRERALAAYMMGEARAAQADTADAITWIRRAVDLDPSNRGYVSKLRELTGGPP